LILKINFYLENLHFLLNANTVKNHIKASLLSRVGYSISKITTGVMQSIKIILMRGEKKVWQIQEESCIHYYNSGDRKNLRRDVHTLVQWLHSFYKPHKIQGAFLLVGVFDLTSCFYFSPNFLHWPTNLFRRWCAFIWNTNRNRTVLVSAAKREWEQ